MSIPGKRREEKRIRAVLFDGEDEAIQIPHWDFVPTVIEEVTEVDWPLAA